MGTGRAVAALAADPKRRREELRAILDPSAEDEVERLRAWLARHE